MSDEFYTVEVRSIDWLPVLNRMINMYDKDGFEASIVIDPAGEFATYNLKRSVIPAEALAKTIGSTVAAVTKAPRIVLKAFKQVGWQKATVDYYGVA